MIYRLGPNVLRFQGGRWIRAVPASNSIRMTKSATRTVSPFTDALASSGLIPVEEGSVLTRQIADSQHAAGHGNLMAPSLPRGYDQCGCSGTAAGAEVA